MKDTPKRPINTEDVMSKITNFKKEMEEITASKLQANKEKEELVNDIFNKKIKEDIEEIYPVIDALAVEIGYDAVILRNGGSRYPRIWSLDFKQKDEIIGNESKDGTLLVILPTDPADINSSTAIYADKATIAISDELKTEEVAMKWQNAKEDILTVVASTINNVLSSEKTTLDKMRKENQHLKENVLKDFNDKPFSADDLINTFSSTSLELLVYGDYLYVYDSCHEGEKEHDYGIYDRIPLEEAEKNGISIENIPDIYVDGYVNFLLFDELKKYDFPDVVQKMIDTGYDKWFDILKDNGYDDIADNFRISFRMLSGEHSSPVTKEDYSVLKDNRIIKAIEKVYGSDKKKDDVERD